MSALVWRPMDQPPVVEPGGEARVLVAWRSRSSGERSSSEMHYLNALELHFDEPPAGAEYRSNGWYVCTGWHDCGDHPDGERLFTPLDGQFVEHLGWTPMPTMPETGQ